MTTSLYQITGYYRGARDAQVQFSVQAIGERMVRDFIKGYVPEFVITQLQRTAQQEATHYAFQDVNPVIAARFHLGNRRRSGSAVCRHRKRINTGSIR